MFTLLATLATLSSAQNAPDSSRAHSGSTGLRFERNVNTLVWDLGGLWRWEDGGWSTNFDERFIRTLIQSGTSNIRDDQNLQFAARRTLGSAFTATITATSFLFTDDRSVGLSNLATHRILGGIAWMPIPELQLQPLAGWCFDAQQGVRDDGVVWGGDFTLGNLALGSSSVNASASILAEDLAPRAVNERRINAAVMSPLGDAGMNRVQAGWRESGRDFYLAYDSAIASRSGILHPIEGRTERLAQLSDQIQMLFGSAVRVLGTVEAVQRTVRKSQRYRNVESVTPIFDSRLDEFRLTLGGQLRYESPSGTRADLRAEFGEREETYGVDRFGGANETAYQRQLRLEEGKNNTIAQTQLAAAFVLPIADTDTLTIAGSSVKLVYDTPASSNVDDRDELVLLAGARWIRRVSSTFTTFVSADAALRHTVYIFAQRSANNTWNRVWRLAPGAELRLPDRFVSRLQTEVTANYTVYDFEKLNPSLTSYALRQLVVADTTLLRVTGRIWLDARLHLRIYERGQLFWDAFALRPLSSFDERTLALMLSYDGDAIGASAGIRYFHQLRHAYKNGTRSDDGELRSQGPACSLRLRRGALELRAEGWYQFTSQTGAGVVTTPNFSMAVQWNP